MQAGEVLLPLRGTGGGLLRQRSYWSSTKTWLMPKCESKSMDGKLADATHQDHVKTGARQRLRSLRDAQNLHR